MNYEDLQPKEVFHWFKKLTEIPRCSYHEEEVSSFLVDFAKERDLEVYQDDIYNVLIKKPASKGYEDKKPIIIQGHMDMVCEKNACSSHDFSKDPLELEVVDGWLTAKDTTLGGDDGIAVAYALALLDGDFDHPALEVIVTTQEEVSMAGAEAFDVKNNEGKYLLNIDGEEEGILLVGCAGGITLYSSYEFEKTSPKLDKAYKVEISGLTGGHSGQVIEKQRANSIKMVSRLLLGLDDECEIISMKGGSKDNAIPVYAEINGYFSDKALEEIKSRAEAMKKEREISDPDMKVEVKDLDQGGDVWTKDSFYNIVRGMYQMPNGVVYMHPEFDGLVETSLSSGILYEEDGKLVLVTALRSSKESLMDELKTRIKVVLHDYGWTIKEDAYYPAWEFNPNSKIKDVAEKIYEEVLGHEVKVELIHAGLECGIFSEKLPETEMISFGPEMKDVHTAKESIKVESVAKVWDFIKKLIVSLD